MHTHFSATMALGTFLMVLLLGSLWRLIAAHLAGSKNETLNQLGAAMANQY